MIKSAQMIAREIFGDAWAADMAVSFLTQRGSATVIQADSGNGVDTPTNFARNSRGMPTGEDTGAPGAITGTFDASTGLAWSSNTGRMALICALKGDTTRGNCFCGIGGATAVYTSGLVARFLSPTGAGSFVADDNGYSHTAGNLDPVPDLTDDVIFGLFYDNATQLLTQIAYNATNEELCANDSSDVTGNLVRAAGNVALGDTFKLTSDGLYGAAGFLPSFALPSDFEEFVVAAGRKLIALPPP